MVKSTIDEEQITFLSHCTKRLSFPLRISSVNVTKSAVRKLQIWSDLLKKFLLEGFMFCALFEYNFASISVLVLFYFNRYFGLRVKSTFVHPILLYSYFKLGMSNPLNFAFNDMFFYNF